MDIPAVIDVSPLDDHHLAVRFSNGEQGILDMRPHLDFGVFQKLKEIENFRQVKVSFDTIEWEGGIDLDPEFVYRHTRILA